MSMMWAKHHVFSVEGDVHKASGVGSMLQQVLAKWRRDLYIPSVSNASNASLGDVKFRSLLRHFAWHGL